jgi:hypothetical protein
MSELAFYAAAKCLVGGAAEEYISLLRTVIDAPVGLAAEHFLARIETDDMDTSGALKSFLEVKALSNPNLFRF